MTQDSDEYRRSDPDPEKALEQSFERAFAEVVRRVTFAAESPEPGFDPLTAPVDQLERFKLPPRPDRRANPRAFANWQRAMSPPLKFVSPARLPELVADVRQLFSIARDRRQHQFLSSLGPIGEASRNWSGAYIRDNASESYVLIQATWMVPGPYPPPPSTSGADWLHGGYFSSAWIGLDGHDPGSISLPQVGTKHNVLVSADTHNVNDLDPTVGAWWQWWVKDDPLNHPVDISQTEFPVRAGDVIYAEMDVTNATSVRVFLKNQSTGQVLLPFDIAPPLDPAHPHRVVTVEGKTAEWIVERPTQVGSTYLKPFCDPGSVVFYDCNAQVATTTAGVTTTADRQLQLARLIRLADWTPQNAPGGHQPGMDHPGIIVSTAALEGDDAVLIEYTGGSP